MKKRRRGLYKYILSLFLLIGLLAGFCLLLHRLLPHPFLASTKIEDNLNRFIEESGLSSYLSSSYNRIKRKGEVRWIHFTKEFSLPKGVRLQEYIKKVEEVARRWAKVDVEKRRADARIKLRWREYHTHTLIFKHRLPAIAIIMDDMGNSMTKQIKALLLSPYQITFSVLPHRPYSKRIASLAHKRGYEVLLHLPMEPHEAKHDPGPGAVFTWMGRERIERVVMESLKSVPHAKGVNNHMGSKFTEDERAISALLDVLKREGIFFVDSHTSANSLAYKIAKKKGIKSGFSDLFLDNEEGEEAIERNLYRLLRIAKRRGWAIGIAHPHNPCTIPVLLRTLPKIEQEAEIIPVSKLLAYMP